VTTVDKIRALWESGELRKLAEGTTTVEAFEAAVGMSSDAFLRARRKLSRAGLAVPSWLEMRLQRAPVPTLPPGHVVKGASTLVGPDGEIKAQWIKTREDDRRYQSLLDAMAEISGSWLGMADPVPPPEATSDELLCIIPLGDPHVGLYAWAEETGADFDLATAERNLVTAVDHLVGLAPPAREGVLVNLGDFFHSDNAQNRTARSGHALDVDTRWAKVLSVGIRTMRRCIERMLARFESVRVICAIGNHDDHSSVMLATCLAQFFEREPRVAVDTSPAKFHWIRFGKNLIGVTHGDSIKMERLAGVMAHDRAADWGEAEHRYWYTGHVHSDRAIEAPGVVIESFRTLAARDAYAAGAGYRSGRDLKLDVLHRKYGRINRHVVGIQQIWDLEGVR